MKKFASFAFAIAALALSVQTAHAVLIGYPSAESLNVLTFLSFGLVAVSLLKFLPVTLDLGSARDLERSEPIRRRYFERLKKRAIDFSARANGASAAIWLFTSLSAVVALVISGSIALALILTFVSAVRFYTDIELLHTAQAKVTFESFYTL